MSNEKASDGDALVLEGRDLCFIHRLSHSVIAQVSCDQERWRQVCVMRRCSLPAHVWCAVGHMFLRKDGASAFKLWLYQRFAFVTVLSEAQNAAFVGGEKILFTA